MHLPHVPKLKVPTPVSQMRIDGADWVYSYSVIGFSDARSKREAPALAKDTPSTFRCKKAGNSVLERLEAQVQKVPEHLNNPTLSNLFLLGFSMPGAVWVFGHVFAIDSANELGRSIQ